MKEVSVTLTLPERLYIYSQRLVEEGLFATFNEVVMSGLRDEIYKSTLLTNDEAPPGLSGGERWAFYAKRLSDKIEKMGGLGLGDTPEETLETLRRTREQLWEEKYAAHFGRK